jgi:hypothetical protein
MQARAGGGEVGLEIGLSELRWWRLGCGDSPRTIGEQLELSGSFIPAL